MANIYPAKEKEIDLVTLFFRPFVSGDSICDDDNDGDGNGCQGHPVDNLHPPFPFIHILLY